MAYTCLYIRVSPINFIIFTLFCLNIHMLSVGRPDNTSIRTGFSSLIRLTRSDNYIKCNKKLVYPILLFFSVCYSKFV